jgi:hypothetical protein
MHVYFSSAVCGAGGVQYQQPVAVSQPLILPGFQPFGGKFRPGR